MAVQTTPHTETERDVNSAAMDLETNMSPEDTLRADPALYENTEDAQTGGSRSFHSTDGRDHQPRSLDEGTANTPGHLTYPPAGDTQGITNSPASRERATQGKVLGK